MTNTSTGAAQAVAPSSTADTSAPKTSMLSLSGIGKRFGEFDALSDVNIHFRRGEIHALLGENGAGKSTLCNLIFGIHAPTSGTMSLNDMPYAPPGPRQALSHGIAMVHQHFSLAPQLTVIDNLLLGRGIGRVNRKSEAERIVALAAGYGLSIAPFRKTADLTVGERQRVEIVKCLMQDPKMLVLDEPTAVLLPDEIEALLDTCRKVAAHGCAVALVTHKLAEIKAAADRVSVLRLGKIVATSHQPAEDIDPLVGAMIGRDHSALANDTEPQLISTMSATNTATSKTRVLTIDGLSYVAPSGATQLDNLTLTVNQGEIVGLAGVEGNGQSELGDILAGLLKPSAGNWHVGTEDLTKASARKITKLGVGIIPEDRHRVAIATEMSVAENMLNNRLDQLSRYGIIDHKQMRRDAEGLMKEFDVRATGPDAPMGGLSGGNQQKAVLARELTTPGLKFLLAAQPTRGLDVGAVETVYRLIRSACDKGAGVLLISSELDEILSVADRVLVIYRGRIVNQRPAKASEREKIGALMAGHDL